MNITSLFNSLPLISFENLAASKATQGADIQQDPNSILVSKQLGLDAVCT